jgi:hypothetical protein
MTSTPVNRRSLIAAALLAAVALPGVALALVADDIDEKPIRYWASTPRDSISRLQGRLARAEVRLTPHPERGYLDALLKALDIPASSQTLVFSKTSFQRDRISPLAPRALYFNDDTYIGWVQGGPVIEISTADPELGAVFYTLEQNGAPRLTRQRYECLSCHQSGLTRNVPGHTLRSVFTLRDGLPVFQAGTYLTTPESPFEERWGGWYVTGAHGSMRHLGNLTLRNPAEAEDPDREPGANQAGLGRFFATAPYLTRHSDIVALLVLNHQVEVHNLITKAGYETRRALAYEAALNRELGRPGFRAESTQSRIRSACEPLVRALLGSGEPALPAPVTGSTTFQQEFEARGPRDGSGRSLRQLDLKTRLFRYPCSFLIYSDAFQGLPQEAREFVLGRMREILTVANPGKEFQHLTLVDRAALREILTETLPGFRR